MKVPLWGIYCTKFAFMCCDRSPRRVCPDPDRPVSTDNLFFVLTERGLPEILKGNYWPSAAFVIPLSRAAKPFGEGGLIFCDLNQK